MPAEHSKSKPRPKLFLALGDKQPPNEIQINGLSFQHERTIKHDSWAATAFYLRENHRVVCKFNRVQPILFLPAKWLGRQIGPA